MPLLPIKKPRVGVVGEILVKFHPTANNDIFGTIEREGAECVVPDLADFFFYSFSTGIFRHEQLAFPKKTKDNAKRLVWGLELFRNYMKKQLKKSRRFDPPSSIYDLMKGVDDIVQLGNITGEGWFLTAEMVELINEGVPSIACAVLAIALGVILIVDRIKVVKEYDSIVYKLYKTAEGYEESNIDTDDFETLLDNYDGKEVFRNDIPLKKSLRKRKEKQEKE